jgi:hypothetical protein
LCAVGALLLWAEPSVHLGPRLQRISVFWDLITFQLQLTATRMLPSTVDRTMYAMFRLLCRGCCPTFLSFPSSLAHCSLIDCVACQVMQCLHADQPCKHNVLTAM